MEGWAGKVMQRAGSCEPKAHPRRRPGLGDDEEQVTRCATLRCEAVASQMLSALGRLLAGHCSGVQRWVGWWAGWKGERRATAFVFAVRRGVDHDACLPKSKWLPRSSSCMEDSQLYTSNGDSYVRSYGTLVVDVVADIKLGAGAAGWGAKLAGGPKPEKTRTSCRCDEALAISSKDENAVQGWQNHIAWCAFYSIVELLRRGSRRQL